MWETLRFVYTVARLANLRKRQRIQVQRLQERRLRQTLRFAQEHSPFYRKLHRGLDWQRSPLTAFPPATKADLMANFDVVVTDRQVRRTAVERWVSNPGNLGKLFLDKYIVCHTSGSQGQPILVVQEPRDLLLTFALQVARAHPLPKRWRTLLSRLGDRQRWASVAPRLGFFPSGVAWSYMPRATRRFTNWLRFSLTDPLEENVAKLNEFRPHFITAYASVLEMLAHEELAGRLRLRQSGCLRMLTNMSEPLTAEGRKLIEKAFGVHVSDHYATGECMTLTVGCPFAAGSHLNADLNYLEVVDDQYRPVPPGTRGSRVLVTNFHNRVMPFIRYEISDVVTLDPHPCPCGSNLPHILAIEGRTKDRFFIEMDGQFRELEWYHFQSPLMLCFDVREFQVTQRQRNHFQVRLAPIPGRRLDPAAIRDRIMQNLANEGLAPYLHVDVEVVPDIAPDPSTGKRKRMQSLIGPPPGIDVSHG